MLILIIIYGYNCDDNDITGLYTTKSTIIKWLHYPNEQQWKIIPLLLIWCALSCKSLYDHINYKVGFTYETPLYIPLAFVSFIIGDILAFGGMFTLCLLESLFATSNNDCYLITASIARRYDFISNKRS